MDIAYDYQRTAGWPRPDGPLNVTATVGTPRLGMAESTAPAEAEATRGASSYLDTLQLLHQALNPRFYLEIGVRHGASLSLAQSPALGIDPAPDIRCPLSDTTIVVTDTSDQFFARADKDLGNQPIDLAFIDGMHWFEFALRDFMNVERNAHPGTLVVFDDVFPVHPWQAERDRRTRVWTGDVWKVFECLKRFRPELLLIPVDTFPTGLLLVAGLQADDTRLWQDYDSLVSEFVTAARHPVPEAILERRGARAPDDYCLIELCELLREGRDGHSKSRLQHKLAEFRTNYHM